MEVFDIFAKDTANSTVPQDLEASIKNRMIRRMKNIKPWPEDNKQQMYQWIDSIPRRKMRFNVPSGGPSSGIFRLSSESIH